MWLRRPVNECEERPITQLSPADRKGPETPDHHIVESNQRPAGGRAIGFGHVHLPHAPLLALSVGHVTSGSLTLKSHRVQCLRYIQYPAFDMNPVPGLANVTPEVVFGVRSGSQHRELRAIPTHTLPRAHVADSRAYHNVFPPRPPLCRDGDPGERSFSTEVPDWISPESHASGQSNKTGGSTTRIGGFLTKLQCAQRTDVSAMPRTRNPATRQWHSSIHSM